MGKSRSDFILEVACERAKAMLIDHIFSKFDDVKFKQFTALLYAPPAPNPGLERLQAMDAGLARRIQALVGDADVDLDAHLSAGDE